MAAPRFDSRRSPVLSRHGCVACSNPLAAEAGLRTLRDGGNAADAAVAVAAALNVTEPCSTGIGGDCFCLFYDAGSRKVYGVNGSGRASAKASLELLTSRGYSIDTDALQATTPCPLPPKHALNVTVPGAAAGWVDTVERHGSGKLTMSNILAPAIQLAETGFPVGVVVAQLWSERSCDLTAPGNTHGRDLLVGGLRAPRAGEVMRNPNLAKTFKSLADHGKAGFYEGRIAEAVVGCVEGSGGVLSLEDLRAHSSTFDAPIRTTYRSMDVWEMPPNGQGLTALLALNILEGFNFSGVEHNSAEYLHLLIEALELSFADTQWYCADPSKVEVPIESLLSKEYASSRRKLITPGRSIPTYEKGQPCGSSDTVYFTTVDCHGNACSFINSNYMGFGTGLVPEGCGFTLHNRGAGFSLDPAHPNCLAPGKRPYHTIIPGMATHAGSGDLFASFGVMGGFMQPQGHVQVLLNMLEYGMNPQEALDAPRFCIGAPFTSRSTNGGATTCSGAHACPVLFEEGISRDAIEALSAMGHEVEKEVVRGRQRFISFGRGQIICARPTDLSGSGSSSSSERVNVSSSERVNVWWAGSDGRADGMAIGY